MRTAAESVAARSNSTEHSGLVMISARFNGTNWLTWSRSVRIALKGKDRLGFIDGSCGRPTEGSVELRQWKITDSCNKAKQEEIEEDHLMQFLMGLSEPYDNIRSQILVLDPLPSVNKAYSMILRVKRQRRVNMEYADVNENSAMLARGQDYRQKNFVKKRGIVDKKSMTCDYCNKIGHDRDTCFRLHGIPEWYKDLNEQKKKGPVTRAYAAAETQNTVNKLNSQGDDLVSDLLEALKTIQSNKLTRDPVQVHFAQDMEMAGQKGYKLYDLVNKVTIISRDVTFHEHIFSYQSISPIPNPTDVEPPIDTVPVLPSRRSLRQPKTPAWLADFQFNLSSSPFITPDTLASSHVEFLATLSTFQEPCSYKEGQGCQEWEEAMRQELDALKKNDTWEVVALPPGKKAIGNKRVYKLKLKADGSIDRYKARYSWPVHQVDINNAFLHGFLDEDIYMQAPAGYVVPKGKHTGNGMIALLVYVDDVLITCVSKSKITEVKEFLHSAFTIKDLGNAKYFLGLEIARSSSGTSITKHKFIRDIITDTGLQSARAASSPVPPGLKLSAHNSTPLSDAEPYRRLVVRLLYLSFTRLDISFGAQQLSKFVHAPCTVHLDVAMHLVRYLKGCPERGLFFPASNSLSLTAYCDADWASCTDSRCSLTGYCIFWGRLLYPGKRRSKQLLLGPLLRQNIEV
ncbi:UNVERIFIED_CONTAM: putative mitochondrial protein [Sesamum latifolium]|uniref:Mitochondrial protein n=1 Tax=Sesamum latifolium TaxID=2727402 RepID=A0AAW2S3L5_9LAMI